MAHNFSSPFFGGIRGPDVAKAIFQNEAGFDRLLQEFLR